MASIVFEKFYGVKVSPGKEFDDAVHVLKMLGGFNNVRDLTQVILEVIVINTPSRIMRSVDIGRIDLQEYVRRVTKGESSPPFVRSSLNWLIEEGSRMLGKYVDKRFILSLIESRAKELGKSDELMDFRAQLGNLRAYGSGLFATLFSELYFGSGLIRKIYGAEPRFIHGPGLIEKDKLIVSEKTLSYLRERCPKGLAIITGRGRLITEATLRPVLKYFEIDKSVFTGDRRDGVEKPDPTPLLECVRKLGAEKVLYVGDGGEDVFLVRKAVEKGLKAHFAGVLTNKFSYEVFTSLKADIIARDVNDLKAIFEKL
ncbi:MAG: HAD family hydrolase [Thaumarchaeota archaeon]|nr:HAD family hydrolase [Nitrososphaerota archaeon]